LRRAAAAAGFGLTLTLAAAAFGVVSLYVPGIGLAVAGAAASAWVGLVGRGARVIRIPEPTRVEEGAPYAVRIRVRGARVRGELTDPLLDRPLTRVRAGHIRLETSFPRRGPRSLAPSVFTLRDPLRIAERRVESDRHEVLVLPRVESVVAGVLGGTRVGAGEASRPTARDAALEFDSLRPYRLGTPASRIHWPTVARRGTMMERRLVADGELRPLVVLDAREPDSDDALDRAVRAVASLSVHLARAGGCALLLPGDRRPTELDRELRAWPALHARLALVDAGGEAPTSRGLERSGAVLWVAASASPRAPALRRAAAGNRYLVVPAKLAAGPPAFTVAGCMGYELRRTVRSAA